MEKSPRNHAEFTRALKARLFTDADWEQRTRA